MNGLRVIPTWRHGRERLYVCLTDGRNIAWYDREAARVNLLSEDSREDVLEALGPFLTGPVTVGPPPVPTPAELARLALHPDDDLAPNRPGEALLVALDRDPGPAAPAAPRPAPPRPHRRADGRRGPGPSRRRGLAHPALHPAARRRPRPPPADRPRRACSPSTPCTPASSGCGSPTRWSPLGRRDPEPLLRRVRADGRPRLLRADGRGPPRARPRRPRGRLHVTAPPREVRVLPNRPPGPGPPGRRPQTGGRGGPARHGTGTAHPGQKRDTAPCPAPRPATASTWDRPVAVTESGQLPAVTGSTRRHWRRARGTPPSRQHSRARPASSSGASRSPKSCTRGAMSAARNVSCPADRHSSTSSQVTGADTVGSARARSVYGVAVVLRRRVLAPVHEHLPRPQTPRHPVHAPAAASPAPPPRPAAWRTP